MSFSAGVPKWGLGPSWGLQGTELRVARIFQSSKVVHQCIPLYTPKKLHMKLHETRATTSITTNITFDADKMYFNFYAQVLFLQKNIK